MKTSSQQGWLDSFKSSAVRWLEDNRGLVIVLFCLPASFIFDTIMQTRKWLYQKLYSSPDKHNDRVRQIQSHVRKWNELPKEKRRLMVTSRPNWLSLSTTFFPKHECHKIPINLFDVLKLNEDKLTVTVEPMVTVGKISILPNA